MRCTLPARIVALLLMLAAALLPARADEAAAWAALRRDAVVALLRHAEAPGGAGDPPGWRLDDCSTQRNLSESGRADARAIGRRLRAERIPVARVLSSPWCRCVETAGLIDIGAVQREPAFSNAFVLSGQRDALAEGARRVIAAWQGPGVLLVVTHGANIQALTGHAPASGEMVIVRGGSGGGLSPIGTLTLR
ncbi:histidine phosphatase family protein [Aquabacterium sp.]|uniref:histidine phosphatase family protein n=1 Tax=Aquabacterium sp. TaxID=1872578 RepID=UPI002BDEF998|nr:histidine phosphatase family protein [Aquabacterium sp.]HSW07352.1 histidine phosphatase family protein [Aquabacterium sp.]